MTKKLSSSMNNYFGLSGKKMFKVNNNHMHVTKAELKQEHTMPQYLIYYLRSKNTLPEIVGLNSQLIALLATWYLRFRLVLP